MLALALALFALNIALWAYFFFRFKKQAAPESVLFSIRNEVDKLVREISREVNNDITLIDDKRSDLRAIIDEAARFITLSDVELRKREREQSAFASLRNAAPEPLVIIKTPEPVRPKKSDREQTLELYAAGLSCEAIAKKLAISITEVQLFIEMAGTGA